MAFELTPDVRVRRDKDGTVRRLQHPRQPYRPSGEAFGAAEAESVLTPKQVADEYLREVLPVFNVDLAVAEEVTDFAATEAVAEVSALHFSDQSEVGNQAVVSYAQTEMGLPVWHSGVAVKLIGPPYRVVSSQSTVDSEVRLEPPSPSAEFRLDSIDPSMLTHLLQLEDEQTPRINAKRLLVYRFDPDDRGDAIGPQEPTDPHQAHVAHPTMALPPPPATIHPYQHYVVTEVLFTLPVEGWGDVNWGALIEPETGSILRLDSFVGCVDALVYQRDPLTRTGDSTLRPTSPQSVLDGHRERVQLAGLLPPVSATHHLRGDFVELRDVASPTIGAPSVSTGGRFDFSVPTDDFAAVNAYFHCDRLFRLLEEMGIDVRRYFDGTSFPVRVDHRVSFNGNPNSVNASAPGNALRRGSDGFRFALLDGGSTIGMAAEWRVVLHEFGHAILWDHLHWPNFRFAHSPGDSLAAILNDPDSRAPDRFDTFPWTPIRRRHDRRVEDGWGWGGRFDDPFPVGHQESSDRAGYRREQILSSTLFRLYRALGGDHTDIAIRTQAARYSTYLVLSAVGTLSPVAAPQVAEDFADDLIDADFAVGVFEGTLGGAAHKVIRWAFERQGAYQPAGAAVPTVRPGTPPMVDIYIDDGRAGGYEPRDHFVFTTTDLWHRHAADAGTVHQNPIAGRPGFLYVRVKNRGTEVADGVEVKTFVTAEQGERQWPGAWTAVGTVGAGDPISSGGEAVLGPISWTPAAEGPLTIVASVSADGDPSNAESVVEIPAARLAHTDNNVAGRVMRVAPAAEADQEPDAPLRAEVRPRLAIPDADPAGVVSELSIQPAGSHIESVVVEVAVVHSFRGDLEVTLESPAGTSVTLFVGDFGDAEPNLFARFSGADVSALGELRGQDPVGVWRLRVIDRVGLDEGTLERWSLEIGRA